MLVALLCAIQVLLFLLRLRIRHQHGHLFSTERATDFEVADRARCLPCSLDVQSAPGSARTAHAEVRHERTVIDSSDPSVYRDVFGERTIGERRSPNAAIAVVGGEGAGPESDSPAGRDASIESYEAALLSIRCGSFW